MPPDITQVPDIAPSDAFIGTFLPMPIKAIGFDILPDHAAELSALFGIIHRENEILAFFDRDKMEKILYNLVSNAIKFTPPEGNVTISLAVDKSKESGWENFVRCFGRLWESAPAMPPPGLCCAVQGCPWLSPALGYPALS